MVASVRRLSVKGAASAKFDETIEIAMNLGVDPRHADQMVRGMVSLPAGTGKDMKVAVFARGDKADAATAAGADKVGFTVVDQAGGGQPELIDGIRGTVNWRKGNWQGYQLTDMDVIMTIFLQH